MPSIRLDDLAQKLNAELHGCNNIIITSISSIQSAKKGSITFLSNPKYRKQLIKCQASAIILKKSDIPFTDLKRNALLIVKNPYLAYAKIAQIFDTYKKPILNRNISSSACIHKSAKLGDNISIGENAVIEADVVLEDQVTIGAGCIIGQKTKISSGSYLSANVTIYHEVNIGNNCLIQSGTVIGSDGFGYANDLGNWIKIPQLGRVIIGNHVKIGACTTIDRGALDDTVIGNGVIIDNQCQIAHNVNIGDNTAIAGGVIMAGSLKIGRNCMIGGASVINGHIEICNEVIITGMSMVMRTISKPGVYSSGIPLQPNKIWRKTAALVMNINCINQRLKFIEKRINQQK